VDQAAVISGAEAGTFAARLSGAGA
jgi:hypothetical protein